MIKEFISSSEKETLNFVKEMIKSIKAGDIVVLNGNLGTGKTFIVKAFCEMHGIETALSPTFAIANVYSKDSLTINHFDFYRLNTENELYDIGFDEYLLNDDAITFIEWGELFPSVLPKHHYLIEIKMDEKNRRTITFKFI